MPFILQNSVFLHIPKTGGTWVRKALLNAGASLRAVGDPHGPLEDTYPVLSDEELSRRTIFMFVRHPLSWYQSRWMFRVQHGWTNHELDINCGSNHFPTFIRNCHRQYPQGWYHSRELRKYFNIPTQFKYVVGRQESLITDLLAILDGCMEPYNRERLLGTGLANVSNIGGKLSAEFATYTDDTRQMVLEMEHEMIERFYVTSQP